MIGWIKPVLEIKCYYDNSLDTFLTGLTLNEFKRLNATYTLMFSYHNVIRNKTSMSFLNFISGDIAQLSYPVAERTVINLSVGDPDSTILELTASSDDDPVG